MRRRERNEREKEAALQEKLQVVGENKDESCQKKRNSEKLENISPRNTREKIECHERTKADRLNN